MKIVIVTCITPLNISNNIDLAFLAAAGVQLYKDRAVGPNQNVWIKYPEYFLILGGRGVDNMHLLSN